MFVLSHFKEGEKLKALTLDELLEDIKNDDSMKAKPIAALARHWFDASDDDFYFANYTYTISKQG